MAKKDSNAGRKPSPPGTEKKSYKLSPATLAHIRRIRAYYSLPTDTAAIAYALGATDRGIPPDYVPPKSDTGI